ncbi:hypothetical protein PHYBOEH_003411 [Phytophthora boehmeriae]|uniref:Uncharacterized protein n=1 Tax=Phytophthora boehmeriae TaxID=109152 RepID=A0A8T1WQW6_9STRA|nr:hypothetical protein PHYBOEH_003411 [Phytophthora boehmeriae]
MEKARVRRRQQQFQAQLEIHSQNLRETLAVQLSGGSNAFKTARSQARQVLKAQYQLGELCAEYDEFKLANMYFKQVLTSLETARPDSAATGEVNEGNAEMTKLRVNTLNWLAVMHFRAGAQSEAMTYLLEAKKYDRDIMSESSDGPPFDKPLTINYALFLHAKGETADAESAAQLVINEDDPDPVEESDDDKRARSTAFMLLASICRTKSATERAFRYAERAMALAEVVQDPRLISRASNNLGIYCLEQGDVKRAFALFVSAYRATQQTKDFEQQTIVKYHLGLTLSYLGRNLDGKHELGDDEEDEDFTGEEQKSLETNKVPSRRSSISKDGDDLSVSKLPVSIPTTITPKHLFLESEKLTDALPKPDNPLRVLTQSCRGEEEYYAGEFHTAEAEFAIAMSLLKDFARDQLEDRNPGAPTTAVDGSEVVLPPIQQELAKLHGLLLSYTGCTQLVEGKFGPAEMSHKRDLALAVRQEDLHAQHRALRNLATVYNATQRYVESIPLWREALEIAVILGLKREQLTTYSGLGTTLRELLALEGPGPLEAAGIDSSSESMQPMHIFMKLRALAEEEGDLHQEILAQRHIVSVYESPVSKPQSDHEASETLEHRLAECNSLVQLCEKYDNLQYRADAYRSLANALTSQLIRLRSRVSGDGASPSRGLADAIAVLTEKRNSVCASYEQAISKLSTSTTDEIEKDQRANDESLPKPEERHARPPLTRLEILQR